jgi:hypothetical protein
MNRLLEGLLVTFLIGVLTLVSCMSCAGTLPRTVETATEVSHKSKRQQTKYWKSIARVNSLPGPKGWDNYVATAWPFDKDHLMTAGHFCEGVDARAHVGKNSELVNVLGSDELGGDKHVGRATVVAYIAQGVRDMCILHLKDHGLTPLKFAKSLDLVRTEDPVTIIGAPAGSFPLRREGFIWFIEDQKIGLSVEGQGGNSGSPVIWRKKVIGMIDWKINRTNAAMLALRSDILQKFIKDHVK